MTKKTKSVAKKTTKKAVKKIAKKVVEEVSWEDYVRSEVNAMLDLYLPFAETGNVGIKYIHPTHTTPVISTDEAGNVIEGGNVEENTKLLDGVTIQLVFPFTDPMEVFNVEKE